MITQMSAGLLMVTSVAVVFSIFRHYANFIYEMTRCETNATDEALELEIVFIQDLRVNSMIFAHLPKRLMQKYY